MVCSISFTWSRHDRMTIVLAFTCCFFNLHEYRASATFATVSSATTLESARLGSKRKVIMKSTLILPCSDAPDNLNDAGSAEPCSKPASRTFNFRLRTARYQDMDTISSILASASLNDDLNMEDSAFSWWHRNYKLSKAKSSYHQQLVLRSRAIDEAKKLFLSLMSSPRKYSLNNGHNWQRKLWESSSFRDQLKKAVNSYCEFCDDEDECYWSNHNYIILHPEEESLLQHVMIVAEEVSNNNVVGFVEVAMFASKPSSSDQQYHQPTIMNLCVSKLYRRQGIASRLISLAIRFIRQHWILLSPSSVDAPSAGTSVGLYVDKSNLAAVALYEKNGFTRTTTDNYDAIISKMRYYMERPISES